MKNEDLLHEAELLLLDDYYEDVNQFLYDNYGYTNGTNP